MRSLRFIVENQKITRDPLCDFSGLVAGTEGYLRAEFLFSKEWDGFTKVAAFWGLGRECPPKILDSRNSCVIPAEALRWTSFDVGVIGKRNNLILKTGREKVFQERGV